MKRSYPTLIAEESALSTTPPQVPSAPTAEAPAALAPGQRLGDYRLEACIGQGASASVWRATDVRLHMQVALKLFTPHGRAGRALLKGVMREARAASRVVSDHVIRVKDAGWMEDRHLGFIAMELCADYPDVRDLRLGDAVLDGTGGASPVYFFSHADAAVAARFVRLELAASGDVLTLSPDHYVPVDGVPTYAKDVRVGDAVARWTGAGFEADVVAGATNVVAEGLYNPYTLSGTIVVDGVLASCHSSWILDGLVPPRVAAPVYQRAFVVPRVAYKLIGPRGMDALFGVGNTGATASIASQTAALFAVVAILAASAAAASKAALRLAR